MTAYERRGLSYRNVLPTPLGPCVYCGAQGTTVDHIEPVSRGGTDDEANLAPACRSCNSTKCAFRLHEWPDERVAYAVAHSPKVAAIWAKIKDEPVEVEYRQRRRRERQPAPVATSGKALVGLSLEELIATAPTPTPAQVTKLAALLPPVAAVSADTEARAA